MAAQAAAILRSKRKRLESNDKEPGSITDGEVYIQLANHYTQEALKNPIPAANKKTKRRPVTSRPDVDKFDGTGSANVILYVGLGMVCIGLVITFVGIGDKGFQTLELKLIGPSLVGCGVFFALLRILFCTVPAVCNGCFGGCCRNKNDDKEKLLDVSATNINNPLNRTMTGVNMVNSRIRTIKHPVTGDRRVPKLSSRPPANVNASDSDDEQQAQQSRPKLKAARVSQKTRPEGEDDSDSSSSTFSDADLNEELSMKGSMKNIRSGAIILNANRLES